LHRTALGAMVERRGWNRPFGGRMEWEMRVDRCKYDFGTLSRVVLLEHMSRLRKALTSARPASQFIRPGAGVRTIARELGRRRDFRGCYVFLARRRPFYVGISKKVIERIRQHLRGRSHFEATLAYRIADCGSRTKRSRSSNMKSESFRRSFARERNRLARATVAFVEVRNPLELYLLEVYAAMMLRTGRWSSFDTH
jgi:hypothetical protein